MPEITEREYDLLLAAVNTNQISLSSLATNVNELSRRLEGKYITRDEDERSDQRVKDELYTYMREQCDGLRREQKVFRQETEDIARGLQEQLKLCLTVIGVICAALVAEGGWIITHFK